MVEGVLRHHISACFAALQRKLLDLLRDALPGLRRSSAGSASPTVAKPFPGAPQSSPAIEVGPSIINSHSSPSTQPVCKFCCMPSKWLTFAD